MTRFNNYEKVSAVFAVITMTIAIYGTVTHGSSELMAVWLVMFSLQVTFTFIGEHTRRKKRNSRT